jgi:endonuclease YncB( thermonuclease family)
MANGITRILLVVATALLLAAPAMATNEFVGLASVVDGDTIDIHGTRIRLWGIDAPESDQLCRGDDSEL